VAGEVDVRKCSRVVVSVVVRVAVGVVDGVGAGG